MSDEIPFSKKDQRKLSPFVGQELLYDYVCRKLDQERMKAIEDLVAGSREMQEEIHTLTRAMNYVEEMAETQVSEALLEQIKAPTSYVQGLLQKVKFGEWPVGIKLAIEVLVIATFVTAFVIAIPWNRVIHFKWGQSNELVLAEVQKDYVKTEPSDSTDSAKETSAKETTYQDDSGVQKAPIPSPSPAAVAVKVAVPSPVPALPEKKAVVEAATEDKPEAKAANAQGYLYRGLISVTNLNATTQKFVDKIAELGGRKAGEVELGWKKSEGTYFHFTIPEAKYEALIAYLNQYGKIKIQKEKHERVMPDGIVRLIITVSEEKKKSK